MKLTYSTVARNQYAVASFSLALHADLPPCRAEMKVLERLTGIPDLVHVSKVDETGLVEACHSVLT